MKILKIGFFAPALFMLAIGLLMGGAMEAVGALSKEIAPDIPPAVLERLLPDAKVYMTGSGSKEVLLLADPFCENSRNAYRLLQNRLEQIRAVKILWVSAYPQKGSEVVAAVAMKMQASGKGQSALKTVFEMPVPPPMKIEEARENALIMANETFRAELGQMDLHRLQPELEQLQRNTNLAKEIGYTGTPHFIAGGRVLHGYSAPAIRILLRQGP